MNKITWWGVAVLTGVLIVVAIWCGWVTWEDRNDALNQSDAFLYSEKGTLQWFELTSRRGKVKGTLHQQVIIEESGKVPFIKEKDYPLSGETTEKGYEFQVTYDGEIKTFDAWFSGTSLFVQEQGVSDIKSFQAVSRKERDKYGKELQREWQTAIDQSEEKEKTRLKAFFSELKSVYGYLYSTENGKFQLFIKIDEALLQGELAGSLLMMEVETEDKNNPYVESRYVLNGITDGLMVKFITTVDGKKATLEGHFIKGATSFDLSFWKTDEKLVFNAVTEEEFKQSYEEFKTKVENRKNNEQ